MKKTLVVVDDFLPNFAGQLKKALDRRYDTLLNPHGHEYGHAAKDDGDFPWAEVEKIMGFPITPLMSMYKSVNQKQGIGDDRWVHNDMSALGATWSCIINMNEFEARDLTGTAFFKHAVIGSRSRPNTEKLIEAGLDPYVVTEALIGDTFDESKWLMTEFASMVPNRAIVFPADRWHARYPRESWGDLPSSGRLIWFGFFKEADTPVF